MSLLIEVLFLFCVEISFPFSSHRVCNVDCSVGYRYLSHNKMSGVVPSGLAHIPRLTSL